MKDAALEILEDRLFFTTEDLVSLMNIQRSSVHVLCSRYVKRGIFIRLKKNIFVLRHRWQRLTHAEFYLISNYLQVPSYLSCATALSFHGVSTQVQRAWYDNISTRRSIHYSVQGVDFLFYKIGTPLYFGFERADNYFIATKEKAFVDACHMSIYGRYAFDYHACDLKKLDYEIITSIMKSFPARTQVFIRGICKI
jgi:predicted transcriptional regulator of viral defense system